jgi:hypothetical protein
MSKVTLRPTTPADLAHVIGEPLPYRIRAITALVGDRVIGMGGIAFPPHGPAIAFVQLAPSSRQPSCAPSEFRRALALQSAPREAGDAAGDAEPTSASIPEARRYPVAFHRAGLMAMEMIRKSPVTQVVATADAGSEVAVRWLKRLGFQPARRQPIDGKILFVWSRASGTGGESRSPD